MEPLSCKLSDKQDSKPQSPPSGCEFEAKKKAASHANPQDWVVFDEACEVAV